MVAHLSILWQATTRGLARRTSSLFELPPEATGTGCLGRWAARHLSPGSADEFLQPIEESRHFAAG
jgi:hypothetical protein